MTVGDQIAMPLVRYKSGLFPPLYLELTQCKTPELNIAAHKLSLYVLVAKGITEMAGPLHQDISSVSLHECRDGSYLK